MTWADDVTGRGAPGQTARNDRRWSDGAFATDTARQVQHRRASGKHLAAVASVLGMLATVSVICEAVAPAAAEPSASTVRLTGAGSIYDAPFFSAAFSRYEN
jgi:hypothetical protein